MVKMTIVHVEVIARAQKFLEPLVLKVQDEKLSARIQSDIDHLSDIRLHLIDAICQPMLPFGMLDYPKSGPAAGPSES